jgi:UDP-glucose 4-epimerase
LKALIFGGAGFVGLNIAEKLLAAGHEVVVFDRANVPPAAMRAFAKLPGCLTSIVGDVTDAAAVSEAVSAGTDLVVLGAAITADTARDAREPDTVLRVNLLAHVPILEAARRAGAGRIVNLSSAAAYGSAGEHAEILTEQTPGDPAALYAITKWTSERVGERLASLWNLDFVSLRLSGVFGRWEYATGVRDTLSPQCQVFAAAVMGQEAILARPGIRDWIYAPDVADAVLAIASARNLAHRLYNVSADRRFAVLDWGKALEPHFPGFRCRLAEPGEKPNIDLHAPYDRAPLSLNRIAGDTGWRAGTGGIASAGLLAAWWREHGGELKQ